MAHYVNNKDFLNLVKEYQEHLKNETQRSSECAKIFEQISLIFLAMAKNIFLKSNLRDYDYDRKYDMQMDAVTHCLTQIHQFDCEKYSNPFAYYTSCIMNSYRGDLKKYKRHAERCINVDFYDMLGEGVLVE